MVKCAICKIEYNKNRKWQETCGDPECYTQHQRQLQAEWYKKNKKKRAEYMRNYRDQICA